ncbi:SDR family NAD(P)-dependent oxidoreductase, partial [Pseudomonas sp. KHB2.9]
MSYSDSSAPASVQPQPETAVFQHSAYAGIHDKVVVVTGGGSGIGLALAKGFARNGAHLLLIDINAQAMADAKGELQEAFPNSRVECFQASVADEDAVEAAFAHAKACFGRIDVLLNNAGVSINKPSLDISPAEWRRAVEINFNSVFFCAQAAA